MLETGKTDKITVSYNGKVDEFKRIFLSGVTLDKEDKSSAIIYGYEDFDELLYDYVNIVLATFQFIQMESSNSKEEILEAIEHTTMNTLNGIRNGEIGNTESEGLE